MMMSLADEIFTSKCNRRHPSIQQWTKNANSENRHMNADDLRTDTIENPRISESGVNASMVTYSSGRIGDDGEDDVGGAVDND